LAKQYSRTLRSSPCLLYILKNAQNSWIDSSKPPLPRTNKGRGNCVPEAYKCVILCSRSNSSNNSGCRSNLIFLLQTAQKFLSISYSLGFSSHTRTHILFHDVSFAKFFPPFVHSFVCLFACAGRCFAVAVTTNPHRPPPQTRLLPAKSAIGLPGRVLFLCRDRCRSRLPSS